MSGHFDRLGTLIEQFGITVDVLPRDVVADAVKLDPACLIVSVETMIEAGGKSYQLALFPGGVPENVASVILADPSLFMLAHVDIGGAGNPLTKALPPILSLNAASLAEVGGLMALMVAEWTTPHCGGRPLLNRLGESLVIRLLRSSIANGAAEAGLIGGLAHPRLALALVAMHDGPERNWTLEELAARAGMSRTQFANTFRQVVGTTPFGYLADWRLTLAHTEIARGKSLKSVALRVGYGSAEALSRAYSRRYGTGPITRIRRANAVLA